MIEPKSTCYGSFMRSTPASPTGLLSQAGPPNRERASDRGVPKNSVSL
jgi:hypothetical protein